MKKLWIRLAVGLLVSALFVAAISLLPEPHSGKRTDGLFYKASGIRPDARLLVVDGETVSAEEYLYWLAYDCEYLSANMGQINWDSQLTKDMTYGQYAKADALETAKLFAVVRRLAAENNIVLTAEDQAKLQAQRENYIAYYGSEEAYRQQVALMGISEEAYDHVNAAYYLLDHLSDLAAAEGSALAPDQETLTAFAASNGYVTARILSLPTDGLDEDALNAQQALLADYVRQLQESDDPYALLGSLAAELGIDLNGADRTLRSDSTDKALYLSVVALKESGVSDVITSDGSFSIAVRCPTDRDTLARDYFSQQLHQLCGSAEVTFHKLYDSIDTGSFYTALVAARRVLAQEFSATE
ncbi:MAG: hypothetical protein IJL08_06515 [Oscillospiraceae bacterium]|nr:hypothetical protein [Oscillospiraceae bacterium]